MPRNPSSAQNPSYSRMRATGVAVACVAAAAAASPAAAGAQTGGGGAQFEETPVVKQVTCVKACANRKRPRAGSTLRLRGSGLSGVANVTFQGVPGTEDDVKAPVTRKSAGSAWVVVPAGAASGPLVALNQTGRASKASKIVSLLPPPPPSPNPTLTPVPGVRQAGAPALETGTSRVKVFFGARQAVTFSYRVTEGAASGLQVQLVRVADGAVVRTWAPAPPAVGTVASVIWNGDLPNKKAAPAGRYAFRLTASAGSGAIARSAQTANITRDSFDLFQDQFPIRGAHKYEGGLGRRTRPSGPGRLRQVRHAAGGGARRQGQDQGLPVPRGQLPGHRRRRHGQRLRLHAHARPLAFEEGDRVYTGQQIGQVGQTGRASGCHLHFEAWSAPGWYSGGRVMNPTPLLKAWDAYS